LRAVLHNPVDAAADVDIKANAAGEAARRHARIGVRERMADMVGRRQTVELSEIAGQLRDNPMQAIEKTYQFKPHLTFTLLPFGKG